VETGFPTEIVCSPQFKLKVTKINLLAFNVQIKNVFKNYGDQFQHMEYTVYATQHINTVIFAVN